MGTQRCLLKVVDEVCHDLVKGAKLRMRLQHKGTAAAFPGRMISPQLIPEDTFFIRG